MLSMDSIMKKAQELQEKSKNIEHELAQEIYEGSSGGGMVTVRCSGALHFSSVHIEPALINPEDSEMLQDLILAACNNAISKAKEKREQKMQELAGGLRIPGLF